tara:strand:+ start:1485 stop:2003 length:519 start_codon:yes stop_codon:yes gene_type:complete
MSKNFIILFFMTPCIAFNDLQYFQLNMYNSISNITNEDKCLNITNSETISIPNKCNCFKTNKKCITEINDKIKFDYLGKNEIFFNKFIQENNYKKLIKKERKCLMLNNKTFFKYQYLLSNSYCSRIRLIFSISFIFFSLFIGFIHYLFHKKKRKYQRLNNFDEGTELDDLLN